MSAASGGIGHLEGFDRVTEDGTEYLVTDVVAQKEGVYFYPDPDGGVLREFAPANELKDAIDGVNEVDIVVEHPEGPDETANLTTDPRANFAEVGKWSELRETDDGKGIGGKTYIRANEVGDHDGTLRRYLKQVSDLGAGEVSTGYSIERSERSPGRHNGTAYDAIQRGIDLDHLALLPNEQGDCAVDDGCGLGRANEDNLARVNNHIPDLNDAENGDAEDLEVPEDEEKRQNFFRELGKEVVSTLTSGFRSTPTGSERSNESNKMEDQEKIDALVETYGLDRENIAHLAGEDCLDRIWQQFSEQGERNNENMGDGNGDDNGGDGVFTDEQKERINEVVEESVPSAEEIADEIDVPSLDDEVDVDEIADKAAEKAAEKTEEVREHEQNIELIARSDEYPGIDREKAERMNKDIVSDLAEDLDDEPEEDVRGNRAGVPTGGSFDETEFAGGEDDDIPTAGRSLVGDGGDE